MRRLFRAYPSTPIAQVAHRDGSERRVDVRADAAHGLAGASRRRFLRRSGAGVSAATLLGAGITCGLSGGLISVARADVPMEDRHLRMVNDHTGERLDIVYFTRGMYIDESLDAISHLMRDRRANEERRMDLPLLDALARLHGTLGTDEPIHLLSGYRTPATNAKLRRRSKGVAKYSLHMEGRAADIHVPGIPTRDLQAAALALQVGGVGFYKSSGFVHLDTGRLRHWERG